jgi:hypothetical protein
MVFKIVAGIFAEVITGVVVGVVTEGDEVYHQSSAWVVIGPLLPSH